MPGAAHRPSPRNRGGERARLVALPGGNFSHLGRTPLPSEVSSFVGREDELSEIIRLLHAHRLVTVTGTGGSGKTRLALAAADELSEIFPEGLWVVQLASLTDSGSVPRAVAAAAGIGEWPGQTLLQTVIEVVGERQVLLVLDNCEHLIGACAELIDELLRGCPGLHVLATSREAMGIVGEVAWPVPPLKEATRLFLERAEAARPSFVASTEDAAAVSRIAEQLDGLPLALELAAARVRVLTVEEIASRLSDSLSLLIGDRTRAARHHTLAATFDWSHALLSPAEQLLFRRLSVFRGGFVLKAAESICTGNGLTDAAVLNLLSQLVEKSLVVADPLDGSMRYRLLEVVRQYAEGRRLAAAAAAEDDLHERHAAYFLLLAEDTARRSSGLDERVWFDRLAAEHDNLRAALRWMLERPEDGPDAARLAAALWEFWFARGFSAEGIGWLQAAVARVGEGEATTSARARALYGLVVLAVYQERYDLARACGEECLALYRELDDADGIAAALTSLSNAAVAGQLHEIPVRTLIAEARSLQPRLQDQRVLAYLLDIEGVLAFADGDPELALAHWQEALSLQRHDRNLLGAGLTLTNLGLLSARLGQVEASRGWLVEGLRLGNDLGFQLIIEYCLIGLGKLAADTCRLVRAARLWGAADAMTQVFGAHLTRAGRAVLDFEAQLVAARNRLDPYAWAAAWTEGRQMGTEAAVAYALDEVELGAPAAAHPGGLSEREVVVLRLVAQGLPSAEVGRRLFLSPRTVDWHLSSIYSKLGVHSRTEAARFAISHGLT